VQRGLLSRNRDSQYRGISIPYITVFYDVISGYHFLWKLLNGLIYCSLMRVKRVCYNVCMPFDAIVRGLVISILVAIALKDV